MSQTRITAGGSLDQEAWDHVLAQLRVDGFSPIESIKVTRAVLHVTLGEAKRMVHTSRTWSDTREEFEDVQAAVSDAAARLQA
ncbi:MAG: hypothetical protein ABIR32_23115 [Ilumatobacteraceae bacterium]